MFTSFYRPIALAVVLSLILVVAVVAPTTAATPQPATGREAAGVPMVDWVVLQPGQTHWYKFVYDYDDSDSPPPALVALKMEMPDAVSFSVETARSLALPREDEDGHLRQPVGVGSPLWLKVHDHDTTPALHKIEEAAANDQRMFPKEGELYWTTGSKATETFYVIVKNNHDHPCAYKLSITGKTVGF